MKQPKLLLDDYPLVIIPELAKKVGLTEAIILQQVHYWVVHNSDKEKNYQDGHHWTYNTYSEWQSQFYFLSERTIRRAIKRLESLGYLISGNFNKRKSDRTKWYRLDYSRLELASPSGQDDQSIRPDSPDQEANLTRTLPETTSEISPETNKLSRNPYIADMQRHLGYPLKTNKDPIPNHAKEAKFIKKMMDRGFTWVDIMAYWIHRLETNPRRGTFMSMAWVNEDISERSLSGTHREDSERNNSSRLRESVGRPLT